MEPWSREWKDDQLHQLYEQWEDCQSCPLSEGRTNVVFGAGDSDADILFCGEAPGPNEDAEGLPFVGRSGKLFDAILRAVGLTREEVYITNVVGCHPPDNRDPTVQERNTCLPRVHEIIYLVDPLLVVPVGKFALKSLAKGRDWGITSERGKVFSTPSTPFRVTGDKNSLEIPGRMFPRKGDDKLEVNLEYDMIPLLHPSYILREDNFDEKTNTFEEGGLLEKTVSNLTTAVQYVREMRDSYQKFTPVFERS